MKTYRVFAFFLIFSFLVIAPSIASAAIPKITSFYTTNPDSTDGSVVVRWEATGVEDDATINLEMICSPEYFTFTTNMGNAPTCAKGGVWTWEGQSAGSIVVTPGYNNIALNVAFTLSIWQNGHEYKSHNAVVTFPAVGFDCQGYCPVMGTDGKETLKSQGVTLIQNLTNNFTQPGSNAKIEDLIGLLRNLILILEQQKNLSPEELESGKSMQMSVETYPKAGQVFKQGDSIKVQWDPMLMDVSTIYFVSTKETPGRPPVSIQVYRRESLGESVSWKGFFEFQIPRNDSFAPGEYRVQLRAYGDQNGLLLPNKFFIQ